MTTFYWSLGVFVREFRTGSNSTTRDGASVVPKPLTMMRMSLAMMKERAGHYRRA